MAKAFAVLEALSRAKGPSRLSALASDLDLQKSTVHRILGELSALGYVVQDDGTGLYRPTLRTWELGTAVVADVPIKQVASGALLRLHEQTGETVSLVVRSGDDALYLDKIISPRPVRFTTRVGPENTGSSTYSKGRPPTGRIEIRGPATSVTRGATTRSTPEPSKSQASCLTIGGVISGA